MNALIEAKIAAELAKPMTHVVVTAYQDGSTRSHKVRSLSAAQNWAAGESVKVGKKLIDRQTGANVCVVSVNISAI